MVPLSDAQRREHLQKYEVERLFEASWEAFVRADYDGALDMWEKTGEKLRTFQKQKNKVVVPIRGPKGRGV